MNKTLEHLNNFIKESEHFSVSYFGIVLTSQVTLKRKRYVDSPELRQWTRITHKLTTLTDFLDFVQVRSLGDMLEWEYEHTYEEVKRRYITGQYKT